jgi:hypothetical protein
MKKEVEEIRGTKSVVEDLLPHVSPDEGPSERVVDFQPILFETLKSVFVEANFRVHVVSFVENDGLDGTVIVHLMEIIGH